MNDSLNERMPDQNRKQALTELGKMYFHLSISETNRNEFYVVQLCLDGLLHDIKECTDDEQNVFFYLLGVQLTNNMMILDRIQDHWVEILDQQPLSDQIYPDLHSFKRLEALMIRMMVDFELMNKNNKRQYKLRYS